MILLCNDKDFIYISTSTGSDVIMTSNCIYDIIFSFALLKTQMALSENKLVSGRSLNCILRKQGFKMSKLKKVRKNNNNKKNLVVKWAVILWLQTGYFLAKLEK